MTKASTHDHYRAQVSFVYEHDVFCANYLKSHAHHSRWDMDSSILFQAAIALPTGAGQDSTEVNPYTFRSRYPRRGLVVFVLKAEGKSDRSAIQHVREELAFCQGALIETMVLQHRADEEDPFSFDLSRISSNTTSIRNLAELHSAVNNRLSYAETLVGFVNIRYQYPVVCSRCGCLIPAGIEGVRHPYKGNLHIRCYNALKDEKHHLDTGNVISEELMDALHEENKKLHEIINRHRIRRDDGEAT